MEGLEETSIVHVDEVLNKIAIVGATDPALSSRLFVEKGSTLCKFAWPCRMSWDQVVFLNASIVCALMVWATQREREERENEREQRESKMYIEYKLFTFNDVCMC